MRFFDAECVHQGDDVSAGNILAVARRIVRDIRRRIATLAERDAAMRAGKMAHLRLPGAVVAGKFMDEHHRRAGARFFVIKIHAVAGFELWHWRVSTSWLCSDHNARQNARPAPNAPAEKRQAARSGRLAAICLNSVCAWIKASTCLSHPEGLVHLSVGIAARDADVAQSRVAQPFKLAS